MNEGLGQTVEFWLTSHRSGQQSAGLSWRQEPELMRSPGRTDVKQMSGFIVCGVVRQGNIRQHDVIKLQTLDLSDIRHFDTGLERKVL
jgi:hypothetical protein